MNGVETVGYTLADLRKFLSIEPPPSGSSTTSTTMTIPTTPPPTTPTKLAQAKAVQLPADGAAWETGLHKYLALAPGCFVHPAGSQFKSCLVAAYQKWAVPFSRARHDVSFDVKTVTGTCKSRLLDYIGTGGAGDALQTTMGFVQKDGLKRNLTLLKATLDQLMLPAFKTTDTALKAAELAC